MYTSRVTDCHSYSNEVNLDIIVTAPAIPLGGEICRSTRGQVVSKHWLQSLLLLLSKDLVCYLLPQEENTISGWFMHFFL